MRFILIFIMLSFITGCASTDRPERAATPPNTFDAVKDPPVNAHTHYAAGQLAESQNNPTAAIEQYKLALKLDAKHLPSIYRLGVLYAQQKQFDLSIKTWNDYIGASENSATAYANLGFCHELAGHPDSAELAYKKGLSIDPKNCSCHINYGLMLARRQKINESLTQLSAVLSPAEAHYNVASVLESQGMREQAKLEYKKAIEIQAKFPDAQQRLAGISN